LRAPAPEFASQTPSAIPGLRGVVGHQARPYSLAVVGRRETFGTVAFGAVSHRRWTTDGRIEIEEKIPA
jgi:hypothetical protein